MSVSPGFPDPWQLIPHRGPMLLVERVLGLWSDGVSCEGRIPPDNPFVLSDRVPALIAIEFAAQAAAVFEALARAGADSAACPRLGYLVSVRGARFAVHELPVGEPLVAHVCRAGSAPPLAVFDVRVEQGGREIMSATLGAYCATPGSAP